MLLQKDQSCFLLIDVQEKLTPKVLDSEKLIANCRWLLQVAQRLNVPTLVSEQYPKGLGHTVSTLQELFDTKKVAEKVHFSCAADAGCLQEINKLQRVQIVIAGIETHVCVMQTAIELKNHGKQVFIVADAVSSRHQQDADLALQRMRDAGIKIITKEMVLFEWLRQAGTAEFKQMSQEFLR